MRRRCGDRYVVVPTSASVRTEQQKIVVASSLMRECLAVLAENSMHSSGAEYQFGTTPAHTADYLHRPVLRLCRELKAKGVFDVGCGNGHMCAALAKAGFEVAGCDPSKSGVENARALLPSLPFYQLGVYDDPHPINGKPWEVVVSTEVIEHLFYPRRLLLFARELLGLGGHLILSTPYHGYLKNVLIALAGKWDFHHTPLWDGGHIKFWSRKTLTMLLEEEGFRVVSFRGCGRLPYLWKSMLLIAEKVA